MNPTHRGGDATGDRAAEQFSKLRWIGAVLRAPLPAGQLVVIIEIGLHADSQGLNAWRSSARIMAELGTSLDTVKRARRAAVKHGLMVVTKPAPRGAGNTRTAEYRLTIPQINGCTTAPISGDKWVQPCSEMGAVVRGNRCTSAPEIGAPVHPPLGSSLAISLGRELGGAASAADEPLDAGAVPGQADALSLLDADPDPEPEQFCAAHRPHGTGEKCPDCKTFRINHERWTERQSGAVAERAGPRTTHDPAKCDNCDDHGWRLDHGGRDGDRPMKCGQRKAS